MIRHLIIFLLVAFPAQAFVGVSNPTYYETVLPKKNPIGFIDTQLIDIFTDTGITLATRNTYRRGLPEGLEKQVWDAWAPGAHRRWDSIAPGYTNVVYDLKFRNNNIYVLVDGGGLVYSYNGGADWVPLSHHHYTLDGCGFFSFDVSPADPKIIIVAGNHVDRTLNRGRSWDQVYSKKMAPLETKTYDTNRRDHAVAYDCVRFTSDGSRVFWGYGAMGHGFGGRKYLETEMALNHNKAIFYADKNGDNVQKIVIDDTFSAIRCVLTHPSTAGLVYISFADGTIYKSSNATSNPPTFTALTLPAAFTDYQAIDMDFHPSDSTILLISLMDQTDSQNSYSGDAMLMDADISGTTLTADEISWTYDGWDPVPLGTAKYNPADANDVFLAVRFGSSASILTSSNGMSSWTEVDLPSASYHSEPGAEDDTFAGYQNVLKIEFDSEGNKAIACSATGCWISDDSFTTWTDLFMTYSSGSDTYSNKGVGYAEAGEYIYKKSSYTYLATTDHAVWRSSDDVNWNRISDNTGVPVLGEESEFRGQAHPIWVSDDEAFLYMVAWTDYINSKAFYSYDKFELLVSTNNGTTWTDVTSDLGIDDEADPMDEVKTIVFDPDDSDNQWVFFSDSIEKTTDGGSNWSTIDSSAYPMRWGYFPVVYDGSHDIMYAIASDQDDVLRSADAGSTWTELSISPQGDFYRVAVLANGDLVVSDDGRLIVIPYADITTATEINASWIKLTIGDTVNDVAHDMRTFQPIVCNGTKIVTFPSYAVWADKSSAYKHIGPLYSDDGGETFEWIVYDLPQTDALGVDISGNNIIIGGRGVYIFDVTE
jgi:hypothetical protein